MTRKEQLRDLAYQILGGPICTECGITDIIVLTLDHITPVGKHRKPTSTIYKEIIQEPHKAKQKYQVLCRNCNWKKLIKNNERKSMNYSPFAYQWEIHELKKQLEKQRKTIEQIQKKIVSKPKIQKKPKLPEGFPEDFLSIEELWQDSPISIITLNDMLKRNFIPNQKINGGIFVNRKVWDKFKQEYSKGNTDTTTKFIPEKTVTTT